MTTAIILNGPPGSGKDTIAQLLVQETQFAGVDKFQQFEFKHELYKCTAEYFGVELDVFIEQATDRVLKEMPYHPLTVYTSKGNLVRTYTPREALIHVSEEIIKPSMGSDYFGQAAARAVIGAQAANAVFSDGGFSEEIKPLIESCDRVFIFHLCRDGLTFSDFIECDEDNDGEIAFDLTLKDAEISCCHQLHRCHPCQRRNAFPRSLVCSSG